MDEKFVPKSLDEALEYLSKELWQNSPNDFIKFINQDEREAVGEAHMWLGRNLRNEWGLWSGSELALYFNNLDIKHADDMSGIILSSLHRMENKKDINLNEQVEYYKEYWKENGGL